MKDILRYFPGKIQNILNEEIGEKYNILEEIRIRVQKPIILKFNNNEKIVRYLCNTEEILNILQAICENSIYTYQKQIAEGFVTIQGGHRVGISGSCVIENGKVININYVNSLNFRISRQVIGVGKKVLKHILDLEEKNLYNTLIISPPGAGKTTLVRDIVRQVSSGIKDYKFKGLNVGLVDERGEIAALYKGVPQNDVGVKTDVIENVSKAIGMKMLIRSMAPQVIVADEIGNYEDVEAINYAICSGCKGIFTAHGSTFDDIYLNPVLKNLINVKIFEVIIFLDVKNKGVLKEVYKLNKKISQYEKYNEENIDNKDDL
ncbi:MAG TPA: stage III sporulation protein AA [Candidatus Scatovivens faecipullorum]|nr:stage III sporulation protein AA [Candidatus Scatovivens faecipullorum]